MRHRGQRLPKFRIAHMMKVIDSNSTQYCDADLDLVAEVPVVPETPNNRYEELKNRISLFSFQWALSEVC
jgi:hypothetical protein